MAGYCRVEEVWLAQAAGSGAGLAGSHGWREGRPPGGWALLSSLKIHSV